ncbi:MAG: hypothetical protein EBE86_034335 [Hormoscilla sp. GUM202]|nr:hypothetical protein [Hormoscilla sp. GUM202]
MQRNFKDVATRHAIALRHGLTIVSTDRDFQRLGQVRTLSLESWRSV